MKQPRQPLIIDPTSKISRLEQVYSWIAHQLATAERTRRVPMNVVRTMLTKNERAQLLYRINTQLGMQHGFTARWSGNRRGALALRLIWRAH